jgi:glyoxylase-like metal-dependent hydrolase (beta-lactamase superfamily II)
MARLSPFYPTKPVDVGERLHDLPAEGSVPFMPGWRWVHTPGHSVGHVALWRESDRLLISGDAVVTTGQESAYEVALQEPEMHGPPMYLTIDWQAAGESAKILAALEPDLLLSFHGRPLRGPACATRCRGWHASSGRLLCRSRAWYLAESRRAEDGSAYERP